jgi:hypothetical protein
MINHLKKFISNLKSKQITQKKLREAYVLEDSKYLRKAYRDGRDYMKIQIVELLSEIKTQKNFDFLLSEMKSTQEEQLKSFVYVAIMCIAENDKIIIKDDDSEYLNANLGLLNNIELITYKVEKSNPEPMVFRNKLRDHLGILEEMKKRNEIY